jgi:hypothetical protein
MMKWAEDAACTEGLRNVYIVLFRKFKGINGMSDRF